MDLELIHDELEKRSSDRLQLERRDDGALELTWGPQIEFSGQELSETTIWDRMSDEVYNTSSAAVALFLLGWFEGWPYFGAIAIGVFAAALIPTWLRARREHAVTLRSGHILITDESIELVDSHGTARIALDEIVDLDASAHDGLELFSRDGVTTTMQGLRSETTLTVAESLRAGLGLRSHDLMPRPERMQKSGRVEVVDDDAGRLIHVTHNLLTTGGATRFARAMLVGAVGCGYLATLPETAQTIWIVAAALLIGAVFLLRPRRISKLRLRRDGTYLLECHSGEPQTGLLSDFEDVVLERGRVQLLAKPSPTAMSSQTHKLRDIVEQFRQAAPELHDDEDVVFDTSESVEEVAESAEEVEAVTHSDPTSE